MDNINGLTPEEEYQLLMEQQEKGRGDNDKIDPGDVVEVSQNG